MKKMLNFKYVIVGFLLVLCGACSDFLDLEPKNKIPGESVLSDPNGIKSFLADLYYGSPIEDFVYMPAAGFNARGNTGSLTLAQYALEAIHSEWPNWNQFANDWWNKGKYQSADDVYSQFGYFGRGKGCVDGGSPFLKGVYLFWFGEALWGGIHHYEVSGV